MEFEGSYFDDNPYMANILDNSEQNRPAIGSVTLQIQDWELGLRNFNASPRRALYRHQLAERSQSSLSYVTDSQLLCSMTNKLGAQHGFVQRLYKHSHAEETLTLSENLRRRRSRSADSRLSQNCAGRASDQTRIAPTSRSYSEDRSTQQEAALLSVKIQINGKVVDY